MMKLASGHTAVELEGEELKRLERDFTGYNKGIVRLQPDRWFFAKAYTKFADKIYNMQWKPSDVCIMTYPKCGTTWMQEIIWTMRNNPDLDNPMASAPLYGRSPFLEMDFFLFGTAASNLPEHPDPNDPLIKDFKKKCPGKKIEDGLMLQLTDVLPEPRTIKTHLNFDLLSPQILDNAKVVFVARNPKDTIVSYHHHSRLIRGHGYTGTFEEFVKYFLADDLQFSPYWLMLRQAWERRSHPNMHLVFFEDFKADIKGELRKLDTFIGTGLSDKQIDNVAEYTSFKSMKERGVQEASSNDSFWVKEVLEKDGGFMRKGTAGDWKNKFTPELEKLVDDWTQKHLGDIGLSFKYSL
ncbi:unnamed protein product [Meganyctiphanes norvegica]|uniref:Sulfotransferase domain-containing protein n=1 Tax=Meganyctiphanes norvegica TaxID=48144 RepID=A0AAV2Q1W9_MEGNR